MQYIWASIGTEIGDLEWPWTRRKGRYIALFHWIW